MALEPLTVSFNCGSETTEAQAALSSDQGLEWLGFCMGKTQALRRFPGHWCTPWQVPGPAWEFGQFGGARAEGISAAGTIYKRN
jgi:hypothetical protein